MTKILNSLRVTGTGSNTQALGVTGGYVNINGNLSVGTWNPSSGTNFYILSGSSSTNPMIIRNRSNTSDIFKVYDNGSIEINNGQTSSLITTLTLGSTSSVNGVGVLQIGSTNSGLRIVGGTAFASFLSPVGDFVFNNTINDTLNYNSLWFDIGTTSSNIPIISSNTNQNRPIRLASGGGNLILSTNYATGTTYSTIDRFIIPGTTSFSNPRFVNIGTLQIENIGISTRNIGTTSNSFPNTLLIGGSQSSISITGTTFAVPSSWAQGSIFITPGGNINMTASHFPVSGLTHTNNSNIIIVASLNNVPTGNYNLMIGGGSKITTGTNNVGLGNALAQSNPALGELTTGSQNVAVGSNAMGRLVSGSNNTALGDRSLNSTSTGFSNNVGIGIQSGQSVGSSNNIFIGANAGRSYDGMSDSVLYLSTHVFTSNARVEAAATHYSSTYATWSGTVPSWVSNGNIAIIGNESSGSRESSTVNNTGTFRSLFFGKGMWHLSTSLNTYVISTSMPTLMTWTSSGSITPNNDAPGSSLELIAGVGRGGGTAGDLYFSTGQLTTSGTSSLQNKVTRMSIKGGSGFIGIGTQSPSTLLHIWGTSSVLRIQDGSQGSNKVLVSDANGNASWGTASSGTGTITGGGTTNYVPLFTSSTGLTISNIYQGTSSGTILIGYTSSSSTYDNDTNVLRVKGDVYFDNDTLTKKFYLNGTYLFDDNRGSLALGYQALGGNSASSNNNQNLAIGYQSLYNSSSTNYSLGIGYQSLYFNTASDNLAIGYLSLKNNTTGTPNLAIGKDSLFNNTTGINQIAIGKNALKGLTSGDHNISIGVDSFLFTGQGTHNVSVGHANFAFIISGSNNTALGSNVMNNASYSNDNLAIGKRALYGATGASNSYNVAIGNQSLYFNNTGQWNVAIGYNSLLSNTTGNYNVAIGMNSLYYSVTGSNNISIGMNSLYYNVGGSNNIAIGLQSLFGGNNANFNIAIGDQSLYSNSISPRNIAIGYQSQYGTTSSVGNNISIGHQSLFSNSSGYYNTSLGPISMYSNKSGFGNIAIGYASLFSPTNSNYNIAIGYQSQYFLTSGQLNLSIGYNSLYNNTIGNYNVGIGYLTLNTLRTGSNNVAMGQESLKSMTGSSSNNTAIGYYSGGGFLEGSGNILITSTSSNIGLTSGNFNTVVGQSVTFAESVSSNNTVIGGKQVVPIGMSNSVIIGNGQGAKIFYTFGYNIAIGEFSLYTMSPTSSSDYGNVAIGYSSMRLSTTGQRNVAIGVSSLYRNTTGIDQVAVGYAALSNNTTGSYNVGVGSKALELNTTGQRNVAFGYYNMRYNETGSFNLAIGHSSLYYGLSNSNVALGHESLYNARVAAYNVAVGANSGYGLGVATTSDVYNTFVGARSGYGLSAGSYNTFVGSSDSARPGFATGSYNTWVGSYIIGNSSSNTHNTVIGANVAIGAGVTNSIILADGTGNQRVIVNSQGNVGINQGFSGLTYSKVIITGDTSTAVANPGYDYVNNALVIKNSSGRPFFVARNDKSITINSSGASDYFVANPSSTSLSIISPTSDSTSYAMWLEDSNTNYFYRLRSDGYASFAGLGSSVRVGINKDISSLIYDFEVVGTASFVGDFALSKASNKSVGTVSLVAGAAAVSNTSITSNSIIFLSKQTNGNPAGVSVTSKNSGSGFSIGSSNAGDTDTVAYLIIQATP